MTLLNDYLNHYTEKLARANPEDPSKIKIDGTDFQSIIKDVNADAYNPYEQVHKIKKFVADCSAENARLKAKRKHN